MRGHPEDSFHAPSVVEVDSLDLDSRAGRLAPGERGGTDPIIAYLQYTSGSTRTPAGVMVSQKNLSTTASGGGSRPA